MRYAWLDGWQQNQNEINDLTQTNFFNFIQRLKKIKLPVSFYPEFTYASSVNFLWQFQDDESLPKVTLKTITDSQGNEIVQGEYNFLKTKC